MPCDSVITIELTSYVPATLLLALKALGLNPREPSADVIVFNGGAFTRSTGKLELYGRDRDRLAATTADIRKAYTREGVAAAARRQGLRVELDKKDPAVLRITSDGRLL